MDKCRTSDRTRKAKGENEMPKERSASFTIASRHLVLAEVHGKVAADNQVHQSQLATAEGQNLHLAASLAIVISGQLFKWKNDKVKSKKVTGQK